MPLTVSEQDKIKVVLESEKKRLEEELATFATRNVHNKNDYNAEFPELGSKDDENAAEVSMYSDNLSLERRLESDLKDVTNALQRIADSLYGVCQYCGEEIDATRLMARPVSSSCVKCKEGLKTKKL